MSSQPEPSPRHDPRRVTADADAAATSKVIAALRRQLRDQDILEHPAVSRELRKLDEQLTAQLTGTGQTGGRHRVPTTPTSARHPARTGGDQPARAALGIRAATAPRQVSAILAARTEPA
jgi:hypothetical protein